MKRVGTILRLAAVATMLSTSPGAAAETCIAGNLKVDIPRGRVIYVRKNGIEDPIPSASLELLQLKNDEWVTVAKTSSDSGGRFVFNAVPSGSYELVVRASEMTNYGARLRVTGSSKARVGDKEIVIVMEFAFSGCGHATVRNTK